MNILTKLTAGIIMCAISGSTGFAAESASAIRVLFLGDNDHHRPEDRFKQLQPVLAEHGIKMTYTTSLDDLSAAKLAGYDCLMIYANHTKISPAQEEALLSFVEQGGGLAAIHCASYCFLNSPRYIELVGAQFKSHGTGVFKETIVNSSHPILKGLSPIESWDETYVHSHHNTNRVVLAERRDSTNSEPYTWVRESGRGRVFYTAWGHDQRTWGNTDFQKLVENGVRWASEKSPSRLHARAGLAPFEYVDAPSPLPNYVPNAQWGTQGEPLRKMQKPITPEESLKHIVTLPGFEVKPFAAEPDIAKPICMAWDERGRLWIAETVDYPNNMQAPGEGHDRIKICEDTDGDGKADKFTIFADKLSVPTGFAFARGGIIVVHSGKTEFLRDTNGDDKADIREVLFTGWGTRDTHAGPSNLRHGFDNWIWGTVGYSGFDGMVGGKHLRFDQGIYRFKPDGSAMEFVRSTDNNTWGLGLSEDNVVFGSTANNDASVYMPIANRHYEAVSGWSASRLETIADSQEFFPVTTQVRQVDWHGKYTAGAGGALYTARSFPKEYWNQVQFVAEPTGHLLGKFHLEQRGADFAAHNGRSFLASDDEWTSPIFAETGPDGALWMIDWYNYVVQHNPTPHGFQTGKGNAYETPLRDKTHGRIYRITYKDAKPSKLTTLAGASGDQLVQALKSDNLFWRLTAQRLLVERRQTDVVPALCTLTREQTIDEIGLTPAAIHALWTLQGLGAVKGDTGQVADAVVSALSHPSAGVRKAAVQVLPRTSSSLEQLLSHHLIEDPTPQVRLAAFLALSEMPVSDKVGPLLFATIQEPRNTADKWILDAATCAAARDDLPFIKAAMAELGSTKKDAGSFAANLIKNPSFEETSSGGLSGWRTATYGGKAEFSSAEVAHEGQHSVKISSTDGADGSWSMLAPVRPGAQYRLSGWIKTEAVARASGNAIGALLNVHELNDPKGGATQGVIGTHDWTRVEMTFASGTLSEVTINCLLGGWGLCRGTAWFDDIRLEEISGAASMRALSQVMQRVTRHYASRGPTENIVPVINSLKGCDPIVARPVVEGLLAGWPEGKAPNISASEKESLNLLLHSLPEDAQRALLLLARRWGREDLFAASAANIADTLKKKIANPESVTEQRLQGARDLVKLQDEPLTAKFLLEQLNPLTPPDVATGFISALAESRNRETAPILLARFSQFTPATRRIAVATLLRRPEWASALLDAVEAHQIKPADLAAEQWSQLKLNSNKTVAERADKLSKASGSISADRAEIVQKLLPLAKENGDSARGKEVFGINCIVCHTFNGAGGKVGPDLSGIGARDRTEILIDILDPNRSVEANYRMWTIDTKNGESFSGRLDTETQTTVELLDPTGTKHVLQRKDIEQMKGTDLSIMPNGFETLPQSDIKALLSYLTQANH
jgi:putative membrane-bound dehydrogenase-like protein